ncbi:MAG: ribonuclease H-like domain-containing protein [Anaerolineaceae bacterium]|nr:ribonuclease H-like domain-containing protein [Anaerolineaceae bacterium]
MIRPDNSFEDKLKSLGLHMGFKNLERKDSPHQRIPIDKVIDGYDEITRFGNTYLTEKIYPGGYNHGQIPIDINTNIEVISEWGNLSPATINMDQIIFMDTETSGLARGTGTFAFMIGLGYFQENDFKVVQLFMKDPSHEMSLLDVFDRILDPFQVIVTFNGKSFDIPLLLNRHIINRIPLPFENKDHWDILQLSRKLWRSRLPSRRLADLELSILGLSRGSEEIPGWLVPEIYKEYLNTGDARPLAGVFYHNAVDILSLACIFLHSAKLLNNALSDKDINHLDLISIARLLEDMNRTDDAIMLYERSIELELPPNLHLQTLMRYAQLMKRRGNWVKSIKLWELASGYASADPCIEIAKYYEHKNRDYDNAIKWTLLAQKYIEDNPGTVAGVELPIINHRLERLEKKLKNPQVNTEKNS